MSNNYSTSVLNSRLQAVANAIDAGAGVGVLRLLAAGGTVLSTFSLVKPCASVSGGILTFLGTTLTDLGAAGGGAATAARIEDSAGNIIDSGLTVGLTSSSDIVLTPTNVITAGQALGITSATIQGN